MTTEGTKDERRPERPDADAEGSGPEVTAAPGAAPESGLSRLLALRTASILAARYVDLKLGDLAGLGLLLVQAPLIGWLVGLAFEGRRESRTIDFVLAMVAVWFGCFNGCREVVKERLIMLRERRMGVPVRAYVLSKLGVLAVLCAIQCIALVALAGHGITFAASPALVFLALWSTSLCGTALGLLLSSIVTSQNSLIALVPIALIPQLIFSKSLLGDTPTELVVRIRDLMISGWGFELLDELRKDAPAFVPCLKAESALLGFTVLFLLLAGAALKAQDE
jgi:hypothetical protein